MGGFGESESLFAHLRKTLATECGPKGQNIIFETSKLGSVEIYPCFWGYPLLMNSSTAVACGAVLRALRKEDGPARTLQSSYGFIRTEEYGTKEAHMSQEPTIDKIDGRKYIDNTIEWFISKVLRPMIAALRILRRITVNLSYRAIS